MDKKSPLVKFSTFPDYMAPDAEKATEAYGLKVGQKEWRSMVTCHS